MQPPSFLPADDDYYLRLDVHLAEGGMGQDLNGYTRLQVVHDALNEYQRHLRFLAHASAEGYLANIPSRPSPEDTQPQAEPAG